jgi:bifunctional DNase/RNase
MVLDDVIVRVDADEESKIVWDQRIVVLREREGDRVLPIWMGASEGNSIAVRLHDWPMPRPLTVDLMADLVRAMGGRVDRVAITRLDEGISTRPSGSTDMISTRGRATGSTLP